VRKLVKHQSTESQNKTRDEDHNNQKLVEKLKFEVGQEMGIRPKTKNKNN
jgi:hypothetical protein